MPLTLHCDGCGEPIPIDTPGIGRLEPAYYCAGCRTTYLAVEAELDAARVRLARTYEAERQRRLATARKALRKLPDE